MQLVEQHVISKSDPCYAAIDALERPRPPKYKNETEGRNLPVYTIQVRSHRVEVFHL